MRCNNFLFKSIPLVLLSFTIQEKSLADLNNELARHPLFMEQARKLRQESELLPSKELAKESIVQDLPPVQTGWVQWASVQIFGNGKADSSSVKQQIMSSPKASSKAEDASMQVGWGEWLYNSLNYYSGQILSAALQFVSLEPEEALSEVVPSDTRQKQNAVEASFPPDSFKTAEKEDEPLIQHSSVVSMDKAPEGLSISNGAEKFDTLTYVDLMTKILMQGWDNADPNLIAQIAEKDREVAIKYAGPQQKIGPARRKARFYGKLNDNMAEVAELRRITKVDNGKGRRVKRHILRGSFYQNPLHRGS